MMEVLSESPCWFDPFYVFFYFLSFLWSAFLCCCDVTKDSICEDSSNFLSSIILYLFYLTRGESWVVCAHSWRWVWNEKPSLREVVPRILTKFTSISISWKVGCLLVCALKQMIRLALHNHSTLVHSIEKRWSGHMHNHSTLVMVMCTMILR